MHHLASTKPLLSHELVGRESELQALREALHRAATGQPQLVLLSGEAGMGKTKLCRTFMLESQAQQAQVLLGQAISQDATLPFGPFLDAFQRYFMIPSKTPSPPNDSLRTALAFLFQLLPELAALFPEITPVLETKQAAVQSQQAVFHGILRVLQELARSSQGSLLLVLEDLHWADETSLEWLAFLAQRLDVNRMADPSVQPAQSTAFMIVGTYRSEALSDAPALNRLLVQLHTQRRDSEVSLVPLSFEDHRHCLNTILEQPVPEKFAASLFAWDEGNPFFMEELLGAMATNGRLYLMQHAWHIAQESRLPLPSSIATAILDRFVKLPSADQEILSYAAVIGRVFDFPLLATLCAVDERELVNVLRRAMNVQLINEVSQTQPFLLARGEQERYQFRHALTREAIYGQMLAPERRLRHRKVAETIEMLANAVSTTRGNSTTLFQRDTVARLLAEHYWLAGMPEQARPQALYEAERAKRVFAFREERHYLNMAQSSLPDESAERLQLLQRMGMLSLGIYDFADALHWLTLAKEGYQHIGYHHQALQVMANLLFANWFLSSSSMLDLLAEVETAAEAVFTDPDPASRDAETLVVASLIAHYYTVHSLYTRSSRWIERCFALFESLDDPRKVPAIQLSHITRGWLRVHQHASGLEESIAEIRNGIALAGQFSLPDVIMIGHTTLAWLLIYWGRSDEVEHVLKEAAEHEERSGSLLPLFLLGWQRFFSGEQWEQGIEQLRRGAEHLDLVHASYLAATARVALAHLLLARNALDEAEMYLQAAQPALETNNEYIYLTPLWWGFAKLLQARGNLHQSDEWYERIFTRWKSSEDTFVILPMLLDGILLYAESGNTGKAWQWFHELRVHMRRTDNPVGAAALLQAEGVLRAAAGKLEEAILLLRQAEQAWDNLKWRYYHALAAQRLAEVLLAWSRKSATPPNRLAVSAAREEAELLLNKALAVYEDLRILPGIQCVQALRSRTHLDAQRKRSTTLKTRHTEQGLTSREMQVLFQVVGGRTNKEIAAILSISPGTVEVHMSHILAKLGCETRTQVATYAIAQGWVKNRTS